MLPFVAMMESTQFGTCQASGPPLHALRRVRLTAGRRARPTAPAQATEYWTPRVRRRNLTIETVGAERLLGLCRDGRRYSHTEPVRPRVLFSRSVARRGDPMPRAVYRAI